MSAWFLDSELSTCSISICEDALTTVMFLFFPLYQSNYLDVLTHSYSIPIYKVNVLLHYLIPDADHVTRTSFYHPNITE